MDSLPIKKYREIRAMDLAGRIVPIAIKQEEGEYFAWVIGTRIIDSADTIEEAVDKVLEVINKNSPARFKLASQVKQQKILDWIEKNVKPGRKKYNSYQLKHFAEDDIGEYINNGEMKGAMLQAGYEPHKDTLNYINWGFQLREIPHRMLVT